MPIEIDEDFDQADGGYAIVTLPKSIGDDDGGLRIKRLAGEPDKLGPKGWQPHDAIVKPFEVREVAGKSVLYFGPEITQYLMEDSELEISVVALNSTERLVWPYITPTVHGDGGRGKVGGHDKPIIVEPPVTPGADPIEPLGPENGEGTGEGTKIVDPPIADPDDDNRFNFIWLIPIVAVAALAVFLILPSLTEQTVKPDLVLGDEPIAQGSTDDEPIPAVVPAPEVGDTRESLMAQATACVSDACDGETFFDIATRLEAIGEDDLFAIMGFAADNGSVPAMEWLGRSYDPLHFEANEGLSNPDLSSAFLYYSQAVDAGSDLAAPAKEALCAALTAPGDAEWTVAPSDADIAITLEGNCQ